MRIVDVRERTVALGGAERSANINFDAMTASALAVVTDQVKDGKPLIGYAFDTIGRYGHGGLLRERFIPRLLAASPDSYALSDGIDPAAVWNIVMANEKFGGHGERSGAVGLIDAAIWDLKAKAAGQPLWQFLGGETPAIPVYASGGHYRHNDDVRLLKDDIARAIDAGNTRFKIKIGGQSLPDDMARIEGVLSALSAGMSLALDANGIFDAAAARAYLDVLDGHAIAWLEEPVTALDFALLAEVVAMTDIPIATGENLFSFDDARNLRRYGGLRPDRDLLQFDVLAAYGIVEYDRILADHATHGWKRAQFAPHAGHLFGMQLVAGRGLGGAEQGMAAESLFGRITAHLPVTQGTVSLPDIPGVGFEASPAFDDIFKDLT
ncbi:enolase C-terminal domain-like protein [Chachezhania sediminis]|uniref:enolase C-terminal domain-like protein n=1 Tax=Chachezhania sediminis TaxID=2599291 RepID=UPI00131C2A7D|nr:enolase C-terminal domain-like protein [Chachezhania sediminis]